jgi:hypothetical protein
MTARAAQGTPGRSTQPQVAWGGKRALIRQRQRRARQELDRAEAATIELNCPPLSQLHSGMGGRAWAKQGTHVQESVTRTVEPGRLQDGGGGPATTTARALTMRWRFTRQHHHAQLPHTGPPFIARVWTRRCGHKRLRVRAWCATPRDCPATKLCQSSPRPPKGNPPLPTY